MHLIETFYRGLHTAKLHRTEAIPSEAGKGKARCRGKSKCRGKGKGKGK